MCKSWGCLFGVRRRSGSVRIVPILGLVREQKTAAVPTPQYHRWPLLGEVIMAFTLADSQEVDLTTDFTSKKGHPAVVDGVPEWFADNTELIALVPAADGLSCVVRAVGPLGTGTVSLKADADMGAGVEPVVGLFEVQITAGKAVLVKLKPGEPRESAEPEPV